jgi:hypothetical protein
LTACKEPIANPNFLEENISKSPGTYISRPNLMCYRDQSKAFVITVNRVQDTHCNPFDDADQTDVQTLNTLYNEKNKTLDIQTIAKLKRKTIHVGAEYFKLK